MNRLIGWLLHLANTAPDWLPGGREPFYALKERILLRRGRPDGQDVQHIPGKVCWSCDGTGGLYEPGGCYKCWGDGWFKRPKWVVLARYRLGRHTFHIPGDVVYTNP